MTVTTRPSSMRRRSGRRSSSRRRRARGPRWLAFSRRRWFLVAVIVIPVLVVAGLAAWEVLGAARQLKRAKSALLLAGSEVEAGQLGAARQHLSEGDAEIVAARRTLDVSPEVKLVGVVPVVHQNFAAVRRSVNLAFDLTDAGLQMLDTARPLEGPTGRIQLSMKSGAVPLDVMTALRDELRQLLLVLPGPDEVPKDPFVVGPIASTQKQLYAEAAKRRAQFVPIASTLDLLSDMAGAAGPRHYLIAAANAAEMRGTGGMILSYGSLRSANGKFTLGKFGQIDDLALTAPAPVPTPPDYVKNFSEYSPTLFWRNANLGADFATAGPVMEAMYQQATGQPVDGVIEVDSMALSGLLAITGPVTVPDVGLVTADNVVDITLNRAYAEFPDRAARKEYMGQVAEAAFNKLLTGSFSDLRALGTNVNNAVRQRNVQFHATTDAPERDAQQLGLAGSPPATPDSAQLTVQNLTGNKVDYYLDTGLRLTGERMPGKLGHLSAQITVTNTSPPNSDQRAIFGPFLPRFQAGEYQALVSLYVPAGASLRRTAGLDDPASMTVGGENGRTVVTFRSSVLAASSRVFTLDFDLPPPPPGAYAIELTPVSRVRPTSYAVDVETGRGRLRKSGPLLTTTILTK
ncbi:MAG: DUF4012 domain-containing protein [Acidimicrobiia bacterium]|nr:DUF4012 domain-containing protein [Acidimicrobiia bacterium]